MATAISTGNKSVYKATIGTDKTKGATADNHKQTQPLPAAANTTHTHTHMEDSHRKQK